MINSTIKRQTAAINIREISPDLYLAVKVAAAKRGLTLKAYVLQVLSDRIESDVKAEKAKEKRKAGR
jgi:predicted DNA binding CopG/RHH family protein